MLACARQPVAVLEVSRTIHTTYGNPRLVVRVEADVYCIDIGIAGTWENMEQKRCNDVTFVLARKRSRRVCLALVFAQEIGRGGSGYTFRYGVAACCTRCGLNIL